MTRCPRGGGGCGPPVLVSLCRAGPGRMMAHTVQGAYGCSYHLAGAQPRDVKDQPLLGYLLAPKYLLSFPLYISRAGSRACRFMAYSSSSVAHALGPFTFSCPPGLDFQDLKVIRELFPSFFPVSHLFPDAMSLWWLEWEGGSGVTENIIRKGSGQISILQYQKHKKA